jgi:cysteine desulfuration protein SufE
VSTPFFDYDNPYGTRIHADEVRENFAFFDDWEDRYKFILELGRQLPKMPAEHQITENLVRGCQSQVWIRHCVHDGRLYFMLDSDAHIVRGLIAIVLSALNGKPAETIATYDIDQLFAELDLLRHLSATRGNGLKAMVQRIRQIAAAHAEAADSAAARRA